MLYTIEHEIHRMLGESAAYESHALSLLEKLESGEIEGTEQNWNSFLTFLSMTRQNLFLAETILKKTKNKQYKIPWGHLLQALHYLYDEKTATLLKLVNKGLRETDSKYLACSTFSWDSEIPDMPNWREQKKWEFSKKGPLLKKELLEKLVLLRTQQLFEAEKQLLKKLEKMFPGDQDILVEVQAAQERYAYDILNRKSRAVEARLEFQEKDDAEAQAILQDMFIKMAHREPTLATDLAIAAWMIEDFETALLILETTAESDSKIWMRAELQIKTKRHLELLDSLPYIELRFANDPETFFATAMLRAQAMWGLGQKHLAIEILESLLASRPNYRSAPLLLNQWRGN